MSDSSNGAMYRDFIMINGISKTPGNVTGEIEAFRERYFDLPLESYPITSESDAIGTLNRRMTATERAMLDASPYDLENPMSDARIRNKFQYYEHLLAALSSNISSLLQGKRTMMSRKTFVDNLYDSEYSRCLDSYGREMGTTDKAREAWFRSKYPALCEIRRLYRGILDEIDVEKERLDYLQSLASRRLTAEEDSVKVSGGFWDIKSKTKM